MSPLWAPRIIIVPQRAPRVIATAGVGCCELAVRNRGQETWGVSFSDETQGRESRKTALPLVALDLVQLCRRGYTPFGLCRAPGFWGGAEVGA